MKFFIDTGNINEIRQAAGLAILDGVMTNPSLIAKENRPFKEAILSPFVGRLDDICASGLDLVRQIVQIYRNYRFETQVLAASLRSSIQVVECALAGAQVGTMPWKVLDSLFQHPLTDKGSAQFMKDWEKTKQS